MLVFNVVEQADFWGQRERLPFSLKLRICLITFNNQNLSAKVQVREGDSPDF